MSYICDVCKTVRPRHENPIKVVVETRSKFYPPRQLKDDKVDKGGVGQEIVKELTMCPACAAK
jgi:hypothetical protein